MMDLAQSVQTVTPPQSEDMVGDVVAVTATTLTVVVRGTQVQAAYLRSYNPPVVGDRVVVCRQDASWWVPGALAGVGTNAVLNASFEDDGTIVGVPSNWNRFANSGSGQVSVVVSGYAIAGTHEMAVTAGSAAQDTYVYSNPISVVAGQVWSVSAYATATYPAGAPQDADIALYGLWFANNTNLYPTTSSADTLISQVNNIVSAPQHTPISGNVTVPGGASFMRVATRSLTVAGVTELWDLVTARRIS